MNCKLQGTNLNAKKLNEVLLFGNKSQSKVGVYFIPFSTSNRSSKCVKLFYKIILSAICEGLNMASKAKLM